MDVVLDPDERTEEAMVQRIVALGFEIRVEFVLGDGTEVWAQLTRAELQKLELREGQIVYLRPGQTKSFNGSSPSGDHGASTPRGHQRTAATQRYLQPSEEATGRGALCRVAPRPISPHLNYRLTPTGDFFPIENASGVVAHALVAILDLVSEQTKELRKG